MRGFGQDRAGGRLRRRRRFGWRRRVCARDRPGKTGASPATGQAGRAGQAEALRRVQRPHRRERADQGRGLHRSDQGRQARAQDQALAYLNRGLSESGPGSEARSKDDYKAAIRIFNELILGSPINPYYYTQRGVDLSDDRRSRPRHPGLQRRHPARAARDLSADQSRRAALSQEGQQRGRHRRPDGGAQAQAVRGLRLGQPRHRLQAQGRDRQGHHRLQRRHQVPAAQDRADPAERGSRTPSPASSRHRQPEQHNLALQAAFITISSAGSPITTSSSTTRRSPISARPSGSIPPMPRAMSAAVPPT